jgi:hypothetical protein
MRAAAIVAGLTRGPLWSIEHARASTGIPSEPGFYAWWEVPGAIPGVPAPPHPAGSFALLYVGIAPRDAVSKALVRSRLCRQHIGGNVASSTFRFGLGALLWETERWTPRRSAASGVLGTRDAGCFRELIGVIPCLTWMVIGERAAEPIHNDLIAPPATKDKREGRRAI